MDLPESIARRAAMPSVPADRAVETVATRKYDDFVELVPRIKEGERQAMEELYALHRKGLDGALRLLGDQKVDHVHDTFLEFVDAIRKDTLRDPTRVMGFARVIGRRKAWHTIEVWNRERTNEADLGEFQPRETHQSTEEMLLAEERQLIAKRALAQLPSTAREILERFYILEQSKEQICCEMGLTETQFRLAKSRAKAAFARDGRRLEWPRLRATCSFCKERVQSLALLNCVA